MKYIYILWIIFLNVNVFNVFSQKYFEGIPKTELPFVPYPEWAHHHWAWINHGHQNQSALENMVENYLSRDIPVGSINIDSGWSTGYNNFIWNTTKFPNISQLINKMHEKNIRWATSMINNDSGLYDYAKEKGYLLNKGRIVHWWHGFGAFLDYSNPKALEWWHSKLAKVLELGIDGWKIDQSDNYIFNFLWPYGKKGRVSYRWYADAYYGDFFNYTKKFNKDGLIMSRPVDNLKINGNKIKFVYINFSPKYLMFSGWVGDHPNTFEGIKDAITKYFHSAWENYLNFGSDIGGYHNWDHTSHYEVFNRWVQLGAMSPLMENGGDGEHFPWKYDEFTVQNYRTFVNIHMELFPFFYTAGAQAYEQGKSVIQPLARRNFWITFFSPRYYDYTIWNDIHVSPIVDNSTEQIVRFPKNSKWVDWWNSSLVYKAGQKINVPLNRYPIYKRQGAIIPLFVEKNYSLYGSEKSKGCLTILISNPKKNSNEKKEIRERNGGGAIIKYLFNNNGIELLVSAYWKKVIVLIENVDGRESVINDLIRNDKFEKTNEKTYFENCEKMCFLFEKEKKRLWVKSGDILEKGFAILIENIKEID